ncbi:hypothetical protein FRB99_007638 [Tulasnella sp. 403]|nr:hypothetical protein FRB99_007638 [Tulasnella sp. 403]
MPTDADGSGNLDIKALEQELAKAITLLKPFLLNKSWIKVPKKKSEIGMGGYGTVHRAVLQKRLFAPKVTVAIKKFYTPGDWEKRLRIAFVSPHPPCGFHHSVDPNIRH